MEQLNDKVKKALEEIKEELEELAGTGARQKKLLTLIEEILDEFYMMGYDAGLEDEKRDQETRYI
jgi:hypothetical protein